MESNCSDETLAFPAGGRGCVCLPLWIPSFCQIRLMTTRCMSYNTFLQGACVNVKNWGMFHISVETRLQSLPVAVHLDTTAL